MKNRFITMCLIGSVFMAFIACGNQKGDTVEETAPVAVEETVDEGALIENLNEEAEPEDNQPEEVDYEVFTSKG